MEIKGLNQEQIDFIVNFAKNDKYPVDIVSEDDMFEYMDESDSIAELDESKHRWWITFTKIVQIDNRFFGLEDAKSTGDNSPTDSGWERYDKDIYEYEQLQKTITSYKLKGETNA